MGSEGILIKNGRVIDPADKLDAVADIFIESGKISRVARGVKNGADKEIDASGKIVLPGLIDMHVHLREPGREDKETVCSGTKAALKGGITSVLAMPNTSPAIDSAQNIKLLKNIIGKSAKADVFICGAITMARQGRQLCDIPALKQEGAIAASDDGSSVDDENLMLEVFKLAKKEGILVISHCEDRALSANGMVNLGFTSTRMGLRGISPESEYKRVERDINLAQKTGARLHIAHVSCRESIGLIADAKKKGARVTCEATPHHFTFSEEAVLGYDTNFKMNPPLRSKDDLVAVRKGIADGIIDVIASDHAPHTENEKDIEFDRAEFGVIGLETELAAAITGLVGQGFLDWKGLARRMSLTPARILGLDKGTLGAGKDADIIIVDPEKEWVVDKAHLISKSKNSAFLGRKLKGVVEYTIVKGKVAYKA